MTSKLVVNTIEADTGISSVSFASSISMNSTAKFHFSAAGIDIGADTNINRPAAGVLGFNINGAEKFRIDTNGHLNTSGIVTAANFKSGVTNVHNLGVTLTGGQLDVGSNVKIGTAGVVTATSFVGSGANLTGLTIPGGATNLDLLDSSGTGNGRIRLGASQDLQIYHDGSHSWFKNTTGRLLLQTDGDQIQLRGNTIVAFNGAASTEYLRIDTTGSLHIASGGSRTQVSGNADDIIIGNTSTSNETGMTLFSTGASSFRFSDASGTDGAIEYGHSGRTLTFSSANANKMRITQVSGGSQPKVSIGALANSAYLNTSTNGDRSTVKIGNYLHLDSGGNGNFTAGMYYNCWPNGQAYFQSGTVAPNSGDNRAAAVVCRYGGTYIYGDNSTTAWSSGNTITSMQRNMQVTSAGYVLKPNNPSFHVGNPNLAGNTSGNVWRCHANAIYSNVGSHYNNSNGRFTAPIAGQYFFFHWGMSQSANQTCDVYSRKNGSRDQIGTSYNHPSGGQHDQFGCSYVRYLTAGDYVDVYTSNGNVYNNSDGRHGGWGGWLIG